MAIFLLDTDSLSEASERIFNSSQELLDLSETIAGYSVENDTFDFASAKNKIAENINKMQIRTSNVAQVISYAADTHTSVQNGLKCQASEGLDTQSSSSSGTTQGTGSSQSTTSGGGSSTYTSGGASSSYNSTSTVNPFVPPASTDNSASQEHAKFVNYYQKDYSELGADGAALVTAGGASTAMAMILTAINEKEITPVETTKWGLDNKDEIPEGQDEITYFDKIAKAYGVECESMELTKENIIKNISEGKYMIISMDEGKFGNKENYVVITGITEEGKIKIADPNSVENSEKTWDLNLFLEEGIKLWGFSKPIENNS